MGERLFGRRPALTYRELALLLVLLLGTSASRAQRPDPLPVDTGASGLRQALRQLQTTARLMHTTAHPDDEDGGMMAFEARGQGVGVLLLTLTRGEGGQNKTGSNLFDELGVLRSLELLESDRYYGVEQRFTHLADFGYSKNAEETFQQWQGHDTALADMVRVIRTFRPEVLVSRFQGASRDGHGHHEAAGILTREAFRAAADPNRFPEQIREGHQPWQAKKLYMDNVRENEDWTVKLETTAVDPVLGKSYIEIAWQGLKHQLSQGAGSWTLPTGPRYSRYKLVDSVIPSAADKDGHEKNFFDGIDTSLPGLAARVPTEAFPSLRERLIAIEAQVKEATAQADQPAEAATSLLHGLDLTNRLIAEVKAARYSAADRAWLLTELETKRRQFENAAGLGLGIQVIADPRLAINSVGQPGYEIIAAGDSLSLLGTVQDTAPGHIHIDNISLESPAGWNVKKIRQSASGQDPFEFRITVPADAAFTRPHFRRDSPETQTTYSVTGGDPTIALAAPPIWVRVDYSYKGLRGTYRTVASTLEYAGQGTQKQRQVPVAIGPPISILVEPASLLLRVGRGGGVDVTVATTSYRRATSAATIRLQAPAGWQVSPASVSLDFSRFGEQKFAKFLVRPGAVTEQHYTIRAVAESAGKTYDEGFTIVSREDLGTFYYYQRATQKASAISVQVPQGLKIGYVMGAGDDIPTALQQIGLNVHLITPDELAHADLSRFDTIVLGIRAYDTRDDLKQNNQRLLDYARNGGTLLVQYTAAVQDFNAGSFTPYPAQVGRDRVSVEEAPVRILAPADPIFHYPNPISPRDFDGWVQERGLYFMHDWDKAYEPLLTCSDPGEAPLYGGLLRARYGKGTYLYTGYAFFRQIPAGVPGAVRLFVNLIAAGHNVQAAQTSNPSQP